MSEQQGVPVEIHYPDRDSEVVHLARVPVPGERIRTCRGPGNGCDRYPVWRVEHFTDGAAPAAAIYVDGAQ